MTLSLRAMAWLEARKLDVELADRFGLASRGDSGNEVIIYPFLREGRIVGRKYRPLDPAKDGRRFWRDKGDTLCAFNEDCLRDDSLLHLPLVITEGQDDCLAVIQSGHARAISVPDGAPESPIKDLQDSTKYQWIDDIPELLSMKRVNEIILCVDGDSAGAALLHDLAIKLGKARCKFVTYPRAKEPERRGRERLKDMNEVLEDYGANGVLAVLSRASYMRVDGVYTMSELPPLPDSTIYDIGFEALGEHLKIRLGDLSVWTGVPSHGKALALDTPLPTPHGWTTMGEVSVGDELYDERGEVCRVVFATPVQHKRQCLEFVFDDGTRVVCDADHLWLTSTDQDRRSARMSKKKRAGRDTTLPRGTDQRHKRTYPSVKTAAEIAATVLDQEGAWNHRVENSGAIRGYGTLVVPPYTLGAWLGDGHSDGARVTCHDPQIIQEIESDGFPVSTRATPNLYRIAGLQERLRILGVLRNKHIPPHYLRASAENRLSLLQGLMDTDGTSAPAGNVEFCSTSKNLADGVFDLACSLGMKPRISEGRATLRGKDCGPRYRVLWTPNVPVFRLQRKLDRLRVGGVVRGGSSRAIVAVNSAPSVPVRCIQVDSPSHLYLCSRSYIPTHNTTALNDIICRIIRRYDTRVAFASFEQDPQRDHRRALRSWFWEEFEPKLTFQQRLEADEWVENHFRFMVPSEDEDPTLDWLLERMEACVIQHQCRVIVIDPWNEAVHEHDPGESETTYTNRTLRLLKRFARRFQVHVAVVAHPAKMQRGPDGTYPMPSAYDISGSAAWYNKPDQVIIVHRSSDLETLIKVQKSRYHEILGTPGMVKMQYSRQTRRFVEVERGLTDEGDRVLRRGKRNMALDFAS